LPPTDNLVDTHNAPHGAPVRPAHRRLNDHQIEVVDIHFGYVDRLARQTLDDLLHRGSVEGGHDAMAGLHGLKGNIAFHTSDLTNQDAIGALPQRCLKEIEHIDAAAFIVLAHLSHHFAHPVGMGYL
jgi:hypothetical protein